MPAGISIKGRQITLTIGGQSILGRTSKGREITNEFQDTTDENDNGVQTFDAVPTMRSETFTVELMVKNLEMLRAILQPGSQMYACVWAYPDQSTVTGDYVLNSYSETAPGNEATTATTSWTRSGPAVFTPGTGG